MSVQTKSKELIAALEPAAVAHGLELVDVELLTLAGSAVVRVYLEKDGSISIDDLAQANAWVSPLVETLDPYHGGYTLEVSSPGINRPLRTRSHFERFTGQTVKLKTEPINGRSNWTGTLARVEGDEITLTLEDSEVAINLSSIKKAHLQVSNYFD